jgi:hypothetical protein
VLLLLISCGGSAGTGASGGTTFSTPQGAYVITVNADDGGMLQRSVQLNLVVN